MRSERTNTATNPERNDWRRVWRLFRPHHLQTALIAVLAFLGGVVEAAFLVAVTQVALSLTGDDISLDFAGRTFSTGTALAIAAVLVLVRAVLALSSMAASSNLLAKESRHLRDDLADSYLRASWATQHAERSDHLRAALGAGAAGARGAMASALALINATSNLTALLIVAAVLNPLATLGIMVVLLVLGWVLTPLRRTVRSMSRDAVHTGLDLSSAVTELGSMSREMQVFGVRERFSERISTLIGEETRLSLRADRATGALAPTYTALTYLAALCGIFIVSVAVTGGTTTTTGVAAVMLVMLRSMTYGQSIQSALGALKGSLPRLDVLDDTIERYHADPAPIGTTPIDRVGTIDFGSVNFGYAGDRDVLHDVSVSIEPGEIVGIIGPSGSGKSTLVELLLGLRTARDGTVTVGGVDMGDIERASWSELIAFVSQDALLLSGSIDENIRFYRPDITAERVEAAARAARIADDIADMPDGFATEVGERGSRLSGGQRQRVAIARALAGTPQLLVLDEPTSALDVRSEALIRQSIADLKGTTTVVIIAHRISTLDVCDRILILDRGRATAFDTPAALERDDPSFREVLALSGLTPN